jgi:hypothetical protein
MRTLFISSTLSLLAVTVPFVAHAQTPGATPSPTPSAAPIAPAEAAPETHLEVPRPSQGYYISLGAYGVGAMAFDKGRGVRSPTPGMGYSLRLGEAITPWLDLGLSFGLGWTFGDQADKLSLTRLVVDSQWHVTEHWFIRAGFGAGNGQGPDPERFSDVRGVFGDTYLAGVGTNVYLSDKHKSGGWVLTPLVSLEVAPDNQFTTASVWLGLEISWWSGLTRDKLELPIEQAYAPKKKRKRKK